MLTAVIPVRRYTMLSIPRATVMLSLLAICLYRTTEGTTLNVTGSAWLLNRTSPVNDIAQKVVGPQLIYVIPMQHN